MGSLGSNEEPLPLPPPPPPAKVTSSGSQDDIFVRLFQDQRFIHYPSRQKVSLSMTSREIHLIRSSWELMLSDSASSSSQMDTKGFNSSSFSSSLFCHQLYDNLLDMKPELIDMFPSIKHQAVAFAGIMNVTINNLETLELLDSILEHLGRTHSRILGIEGPFFELMGDALIKTFQDRYVKTGVEFTIELEDCWINLYCFLANSILQSGIDPLLQYEKAPRPLNYQNKDAQQSVTSFESTSDQESLADKISKSSSTTSSRTPISSSHSLSSSVKKSTIGSTKKALRSFSSSSGTDQKSKSTSRLKTRLTSLEKNDKKKDGTCIVM